MTTKQWRDAWLKIARGYEGEYNGTITYSGLCKAFEYETESCGIIDCMYLFSGIAGYWWPTRYSSYWTMQCDEERATMAGLLAAMTPTEFLRIANCGTRYKVDL